MKQMVWTRVAGQDRVKEVLGKALAGDSLGHAYLLCGEEGCGTLAVALELATGVLCLSDGDVPCQTCESCRKISRYAHPDLHLIFPVVLGKESKSSDGNLKQDGWETLSKMACARIADPYVAAGEGAFATIPVEWIREVTEAIRRGAVAGGANVVVMSGVDTMNKESANALLKTLEEPPPGTLLLLCTARPHDVLPTIASRCQILRLGHIPDAAIAAELGRRFGTEADPLDIARGVAEAQGSLEKGIAFMGETGESDTGMARRLMALAATPGWPLDERWESIMEEATPAVLERALVQCIHDHRTGLVREYGRPQTYISNAASGPDPGLTRTAALVAACEEALRGVRARGNIALVTAHFIMTTAEILNGKQQQAG